MNPEPSRTVDHRLRTLIAIVVALLVQTTATASARTSGEAGRLELRVIAGDARSLTLEAVIPAEYQADKKAPTAYAALIGVPAGSLGPIELQQIDYVSGEIEVSASWDELSEIRTGPAPVTLEVLGWLRRQRIARLLVRPGRIAQQALPLVRLRFCFAFDSTGIAATSPGDDHASFEHILGRSLANYQEARRLRSRPPHSSDPPAPIVPAAYTEYLVLETPDKGLYRISGDDLARAGIAAETIEPSRLRLFHLGRELPIRLGSANGVLTITFLVPEMPPAYRRYCRHHLLALTWSGKGQGHAMAERSAWLGDDPLVVEAPELARHIERDRLFIDSDPLLSADWYWYKLSAEPGAPDSRFLVIPNIHEPIGGGTVSLRLVLRGLTDTIAEIDHHLEVSLNNRWRRDLYWGGRSPYELNVELSSDLLVDGDNVVEVRLPGELDVFADQVLVDWLELRWPGRGQRHGPLELSYRPPAEGLYELRVQGPRGRHIEVYETTDPYRPVRLSEPWLSREAVDIVSFQDLSAEPGQPRSFLVVDGDQVTGPRHPRVVRRRDLLGSDHQADLLIITAPGLAPAAQRLADHRSAQGLTVAVVTTTEIYQRFSHGFAVPEAIRAFVGHTFSHWQEPAPSMLLLLGDASWDSFDSLGYGARNLVPTFRTTSHTGQPPTASDAWFACVSGDDAVADLLVGRLAAAGPDEAERMVDKVIRYERRERDREWRRRVLLVADDQDPQYAETTRSSAEQLATLGFSPQVISIATLDLADDLPHGERVTRTHDQLFPQLLAAINQGVGLVQYVGHGGLRVWAHEELLDVRPQEEHLKQMVNHDRLPVVLSLSCLNAAIDSPRFDTIAEAMVKAEGGAIAFWAASQVPRMSVSRSFRPALFEALHEPGQQRLGTVLAAARLETIRIVGEVETRYFDTQILIGDPALLIELGAAADQH